MRRALVLVAVFSLASGPAGVAGPRAAGPARGGAAWTRDPAGACALKLARSVGLNSTLSPGDLAVAITQRCLGEEPLSPNCALDPKSPCEVRDDARFLLLQQITYKLVLSIRLDETIARSPK